jgi:hypothetical protein
MKLEELTVEGLSGSLKAIWIVGVNETALAPAAGTVERIASGPIAAAAAVTLNAPLKVSVWAPVVSLTVRVPRAAAGSMVNTTVALVALPTVGGPGRPSGAPPTLMPSPRLIVVCPCRKVVLEPLMTAVTT